LLGSTGRTEQLEPSGEIGSLAADVTDPGPRCISKIELIQATKRINRRNPGFSGEQASRRRNRTFVVSSDFHFDSDVLSF
jgi:hypothetical protein